MNLEIESLLKSYGTQRALTIDTLKIKCSTLVLLGPSGGGKSTLLRILGGLTFPDSGTILINEHNLIFNENSLTNYRKSIGVVFQAYNLFPHMTALENIVLPLYHVHGVPYEEAVGRSFDLLKRFKLESHAYKHPYALSGGQIQRVALIRAIAHQPQLLLLDEPTSALDPLMTAEVLELIQEIKEEGRDIIMVTHHLNFAKNVADQILFISEGKIVEQGTAEELLTSPKSPQVKEYMAKLDISMSRPKIGHLDFLCGSPLQT